MRYQGLKTIKTKLGDVLDLRDVELNTIKDIVDVVLEVSEHYHTWDPSCIPDIVRLSPEQRSLFPKDIYVMRGPHNVMEIISEGVDNRTLDKLDTGG